MRLHYEYKDVLNFLFNGEIGLEKESLRVDRDGYLAQTPHPFMNNTHIERDFCENQVELITVPCSSPDEVWRSHAVLHKEVTAKLLHMQSGEEYLWPFSNPPYFKSTDDIPIARYDTEHKDKEIYREYLSKKYGKKKMLFSGIHYNFSFAQVLLKAEFDKSGYTSFTDFKNNLYLDLAQKVVEYSWFIVYLTAASSVFDLSLLETKDSAVLNKYASVRCSDIGYWNDFTPVIRYGSLAKYVESIERYVQSGALKSASELYYPVRLKPRGMNTLDNLKEKGINHIELRMFDLNPLTPVGIFKEDIAFVHMLLIYLSSFDRQRIFDENAQLTAIQNMKRSAEYDDEAVFINFKNETVNIRSVSMAVLKDMESFFADKCITDYKNIIKYQKEKITNPEKRYAVQIKKQFENDYNHKGFALTKAYALALEKDNFI